MTMEKGTARLLGCLIATASVIFAQTTDHISSEEVKAAVAATRGGEAILDDIVSDGVCKAQKRQITVYTPFGLIRALSASAKKQFLPFEPTATDTLRALTIISEGCARGSLSGPVCESITRVALLSDPKGGSVLEAIESKSSTEAWHNGFGAKTSCSSLISKFVVTDLPKVQDSKGEFFVAMFDGTKLVKIFEVKEKHLKLLGL